MTVDRKYPKRLKLAGGEEVDVVKVWYPMGAGFYRVEFRAAGAPMGCLAALEDDVFVESDMATLRAVLRAGLRC